MSSGVDRNAQPFSSQTGGQQRKTIGKFVEAFEAAGQDVAGLLMAFTESQMMLTKQQISEMKQHVRDALKGVAEEADKTLEQLLAALKYLHTSKQTKDRERLRIMSLLAPLFTRADLMRRGFRVSNDAFANARRHASSVGPGSPVGSGGRPRLYTPELAHTVDHFCCRPEFSYANPAFLLAQQNLDSQNQLVMEADEMVEVADQYGDPVLIPLHASIVGEGGKEIPNRVLRASVQTIHAKFIAEHPDIKVSAQGFRSLLPKNAIKRPRDLDAPSSSSPSSLPSSSSISQIISSSSSLPVVPMADILGASENSSGITSSSTLSSSNGPNGSSSSHLGLEEGVLDSHNVTNQKQNTKKRGRPGKASAASMSVLPQGLSPNEPQTQNSMQHHPQQLHQQQQQIPEHLLMAPAAMQLSGHGSMASHNNHATHSNHSSVQSQHEMVVVGPHSMHLQMDEMAQHEDQEVNDNNDVEETREDENEEGEANEREGEEEEHGEHSHVHDHDHAHAHASLMGVAHPHEHVVHQHHEHEGVVVSHHEESLHMPEDVMVIPPHHIHPEDHHIEQEDDDSARPPQRKRPKMAKK